MKFNLKNRPKSDFVTMAGLKQESATYNGNEVNEWFEGFEKELRLEMVEIDPATPNHFKAGRRNKIKEILGED